MEDILPASLAIISGIDGEQSDMKNGLDFGTKLRIVAVGPNGRTPNDGEMAGIRALAAPGDDLAPLAEPPLDALAAADVIVCACPCGHTPLSRLAAESGVPALALHPYGGFHPYQAAFYYDLEKCGGIRLPADEPKQAAASLQAVRARKALRDMRLVVADPQNDAHRLDTIRTFQAAVRERFGVEIILSHTDELKERARSFADEVADEELARWYREVMTGPGEMDEPHMRQVAKLYLAQREMLDETGAVGITPHDIAGFLTIPEREIMPNVSCGPLVFDGYLACEEADIEALTTELILYAGLGAHPTMSNVYFAFRDRFSALDSHQDYASEMELADCRQCFEDNRVTISHFSTAGVLPPNMMEEGRYTVRETLPSWPKQSMISATPKLGPVALARLSVDAAAMHLVYGEADGLGFGDQYGWYRGRWFIRLPDARHFAAHAIHHHYAIAQDTGASHVLDTLLRVLLGLELR